MEAITMKTNDPLLTPDEAAAYLRLARATLAKMRCLGGGPRFVRLGRKIAYRGSDLESWLEKRLAASTTDADARLPRKLTDSI